MFKLKEWKVNCVNNNSSHDHEFECVSYMNLKSAFVCLWISLVWFTGHDLLTPRDFHWKKIYQFVGLEALQSIEVQST